MPTLSRSGRTRILTATQRIDRPRPEVFAFFADAGNLERLTPDSLRFEILTPRPIAMDEGTLIDYRLRIHRIPVRWRTEISVWEPPERFVDRQLRGPYRRWVHEHRFEEDDGGTIMHDRVEYEAPGGSLVHTLFIARDLRRIFAYRAARLADVFTPPVQSP